MSWQDIAAQATLCNFGTTGATYAAAAAWGSAYTGQIWGTVGFGAVSAALAAASAANGCYQPPPTDPPVVTPGTFGCVKATAQRRIVSNVPSNTSYSAVEIVSVSKRTEQGDGWWNVEVYQNATDTETTVLWIFSNNSWDDPGFAWGLDPDGPGECEKKGDEIVVPDPPPPSPVTDPDTGCTWNVTMQDSYINERGNLAILYKATSNDPSTCGPDQYWWDEVGQDPTPVQPDPVDPTKPLPPPDPCCQGGGDCPDPCPEIPQPIALPEQTYQLTGVCEDVAQGQPQPIAQWSIASTRYEQALALRLDAIAAMLQQHLAWRTPTCRDDRPTKEGDFRTISFISDEYPPGGRNYLRKRLRYRSVSGIGLADLVDHWKTFTWQAGPVCVSHKGAPWGAPQVWAATAEEGKRVIRHAAVEAGLDPDQVGRWLIGGSDNPRYGMPGTMKVNTSGGYYWITERLDSSARPQVLEL